MGFAAGERQKERTALGAKLLPKYAEGAEIERRYGDLVLIGPRQDGAGAWFARARSR